MPDGTTGHKAAAWPCQLQRLVRRRAPTIREQVPESQVPATANCVLEIVMNGLNRQTVDAGMRAALHAAVKVPGLVKVTAANFGGKLGKHKFHLKALLD